MVALVFQRYVLAPLAVRVVEEPAHIAALAGLIDTDGGEITVTVDPAEFVQPLMSVPVTVYVVVIVGVAVTDGPLVPVR